jgi:hypothetical protein
MAWFASLLGTGAGAGATTAATVGGAAASATPSFLDTLGNFFRSEGQLGTLGGPFKKGGSLDFLGNEHLYSKRGGFGQYGQSQAPDIQEVLNALQAWRSTS